MTNDNIVSAKHRMLDVFSELDELSMTEIEQWISSNAYRRDLETMKSLLNSEKMLNKIGKSIKKMVPFTAELDSEVITPPSVGIHANCNVANTCHVDEFLYNETDVENLVEKGKLHRHYCADCNSRNIKDLIYISHSMSTHLIQYMFNVLLPNDLDGKNILDVGSRLGAVLYGAYYFTNAATITGIEINAECCEIQKTIIQNFSLDNKRIRVVHSDIMERNDMVSNSDIIVINIPDFFMDIEKHKEMWYFLKKYIKKGSFLVLTRSITDTLLHLDIFEEFINWLNVCKPHQLQNEIFFDIEECIELFVYTVN